MGILRQHLAFKNFKLKAICYYIQKSKGESMYKDRFLARVFFLLKGLIPVFLCSCSSIEAGHYLVAHSQDQGIAMPQDVWQTYGLPSSGKSLRMTAEPSVGRMRPMVDKRLFDNNLSYILYPVILRERALFFGPILFPVLPVWFLDSNDSNEQVRACSVSISWDGDVSKAEKIVIRCFNSDEWSESLRRVFMQVDNHMECVYYFDKELKDGCDIVMEYNNGEKVVRASLMSYQGIEWTPHVRIISAPKYPKSYPGFR